MPERAKPRIAITMGDPCGIGPEIIVKLFAGRPAHGDESLLVVGDPGALEGASKLLGARLRIWPIEGPEQWRDLPVSGAIPVVAPLPLAPEDRVYGAPTGPSCLCAIRCIELAVSLAMRGAVDAVCTCPIHKGNLHRHGFSFPGHTEFLCDLTASRRAVMMLAGPRLRVSLATIHEPLWRVPQLISPESLAETTRITAESLVRDFGIPTPRIAVAALNPHAGEGGRFGREDLEIIEPTVAGLKNAGLCISGPYPADTLFLRAFRGEFDAVVAMYHDQGLIPVKLVHFHDAVNTTLGLPIIRTSVDHGTAYELAGTGQADAGSLEAAVRMASSMARHRFSLA